MHPVIPFFTLGDAGVAAPVLGTPTVSNQTNGSACGGGGCTVKQGSNDTINVSWTISGANDFYFETRIYRDSGSGFVLQQTQVNSDNTFSQAAPGGSGYVGGDVEVDYTYRVDVVDKNTGQTVASATSALFSHTYFTTCPGPC